MTFIVCSRKKSMPKVSVSVCERCARKKRCPDYALHIQPTLFPAHKKDMAARRKKRPVKREVKEPARQSKEKQLKLGF